jgi:hypothetical protein
MHRLKFVIAGAFLITGAVHTGAQQPSAARVPAGAMARAATTPPAARLLPGTKSNIFTTIQGNALNSTNGALSNSGIRLRDARFGRVVDATITDRSGLFSFKTVDPGSYIVELMSTDQATVLAASQIINVNSGDAVTAVVKLPFRIPPFAGVLGNTAPSAAAVTTEAAASGVLATTVSGQPTSDRPIS